MNYPLQVSHKLTEVYITTKINKETQKTNIFKKLDVFLMEK